MSLDRVRNSASSHRPRKVDPVVSKNTNELKTGLPGRFGIDVSTLGSQHLNDRVDFSWIAG